MESKKDFGILFQCEECGKRFPVSQEEAPNSLTHKKEFTILGESIFLTYYDCPSCGRRHYVQIDDVSSLQELTRIKNEFVKLSLRRRKGKAISKKQSENFKKARQHLAEYRNNLMKKYTGSHVINENIGCFEELRFSIWK